MIPQDGWTMANIAGLLDYRQTMCEKHSGFLGERTIKDSTKMKRKKLTLICLHDAWWDGLS